MSRRLKLEMQTQTSSYLDRYDEEPKGELSFIAGSPLMEKILASANAIAKVDVPVLILGERGTGKEFTARLIHQLSSRAASRFVKIECGTVSSDFLESELFACNGGNETQRKEIAAERIALCNGNTILLDQITNMPSRLQTRFLHLLKSQQPGKLAADKTFHLNVRLLATADMRVDCAVAGGKLNEGVYYHLSACALQLPPLRHRRQEIPLLLDTFMGRIAKRSALPPRDFSPAVVELCQRYAWPGNLDQLQNFVQHYFIAKNNPQALSFDPIDDHAWQTFPKEETPTNSKISGFGSKSLLQSIRGEAERGAIAMVLEQTGWNRRAAARQLRVSYRTLLYKIEQYNMADQRCTPLPSRFTP